MLVPIHIKPLLEIFCFPVEADRHYCNKRKRTYRELLALELIQERTEGDTSDSCSIYEISEKGKVYCLALSQVPLPEQVWVVPEAKGFTT